jgi:hypothetical protein
MYPFPQPFVDACNSVMWDAGVNLARLTLERGPGDFPQDGGIAYRNHLYKYVHCYFLWALYPALAPRTDDEWSRSNRELVLNLSLKPLRQLVGVSHFFVRGRQLFLSFEKPRAQAALNPQALANTERLASKALDWLVVMYDFPEEMAQEWLRVITTAKDAAAFKEGSQTFFYAQLAHALRLDLGESTTADSWASLALSADQAGAALKPAEWQPICGQLMALYGEEAKKFRLFESDSF